MTEPDLSKDPDQGLLDGVESDDGDGLGIGSTLAPDVSADAKRRQIERDVYERRNFEDGKDPKTPNVDRHPDPVHPNITDTLRRP
jgi:hypothetical protein